MALMGVDAGITGVKAVVFDLEGRRLSSAYREYALHQPQSGWSEFDPRELWAAAAAVIAEAASAAAEEVTALAVSSMGETAVPVGASGEALANAITPLDGRAAGVTEQLVESFGRERFCRITGLPPHASYTYNHVVWLRENAPEVFAKVHKFLLVQDYLSFELTGEALMGESLAARTGLFDVSKGRWSQKLFEELGISPELFSTTAEAPTPVGTLSADMAAELGLSPSTVVVTGGHDQPCCAIGAGAIEEGVADLSLGTVECLTNTHGKLLLSQAALESNIPVYRHALPRHFVSLAYNFTSGSLLRWYRDNFAEPEVREAHKRGVSVYELLFDRMDDSPTEVLVLPHFAGTATPHMDPLARGAIVNLDLSTTREELFRACAQGAVLELLVNFQALERAGLAPRAINAIGGGSRSPKWLGMRADALGIPIDRMDVEEAGCAGAAVLAGCGTGVYSDVAEGSEKFARVAETIEPRPQHRDGWRKLFDKYKGLFEAVRPFRFQAGSG